MVPFQMRVLFIFVLRFILEVESVNYFASELWLLSRGLIVTITSPRSDA